MSNRLNYQLKEQDTAQLYKSMQSCFTNIADNMQKAAEIWVELQERGENLDRFVNPITSFFPEIASGKLNAKLVFGFSQQPALLNNIATLVPEEQAKLVTPGYKVAVVLPDGKRVDKRVSELSISQARQVFMGGRINSEAEQRKYVKPSKPYVAPVIEASETVETDLADVLTPVQVRKLIALAKAENLSVASYVKKVLVRHKIIT